MEKSGRCDGCAYSGQSRSYGKLCSLYTICRRRIVHPVTKSGLELPVFQKSTEQGKTKRIEYRNKCTKPAYIRQLYRLRSRNQLRFQSVRFWGGQWCISTLKVLQFIIKH